MQKIKVTVFKRTGRKNFEAQWTDPKTGKKKTRTTGCNKRQAAERWAGKLAAEIEEGRLKESSRMSWNDFRELYEKEKEFRSESSFRVWLVAADHFERMVGTSRVGDIGSDEVYKFIRGLQSTEMSPSTVCSYLRVLRSALNWAKRRKVIHEAPHFEMPKFTNTPRGRPITVEEFDRILAQASNVTRHAEEWMFFLRGLWWSGFRISESLKLHWEDPTKLLIDMSGKHPMVRIPAGGQKNGKAELYALAPEFAEMLLSVPEEARTGPVLFPTKKIGRTKECAYQSVRKFSIAAGVKVGEKNGKVKWATPHDFRRSFGSRWAKRVQTAVLTRISQMTSVALACDLR